MNSQTRPWSWGLLALWLASLVLLCSVVKRTWHDALMLNFAVASMAYIALLWHGYKGRLQVVHLLLVAVFVRVLLVVAAPQLSEDVYRYAWDGHLVLQGQSPYSTVPAESPLVVQPHMQVLLQAMNSPNYHSVYPPLAQYLFAAGAGLSHLLGGSLQSVELSFSLLLLLAELVTLWVLWRIFAGHRLGSLFIGAYALNPLVVVETAGNLHLEGFATALVALACLGLYKHRTTLRSISLGAAFVVKLTPLLVAPFFLWTKSNSLTLRQVAVFTVAVVVLGLPFFSWGFAGMDQGLRLYFQSFEFNGSVYLAVRQLGFWLVGHNWLWVAGPALAGISGLLMVAVWVAFWRGRLSAPQGALLAWATFLFFSAQVHPWYLVPLVLLAVFAGWWWPMVWSLLAFLSYIAYTPGGAAQAPAWLPFVEYGVTWVIMWLELRKRPSLNIITPGTKRDTT